jgi:hypothetical protein
MEEDLTPVYVDCINCEDGGYDFTLEKFCDCLEGDKLFRKETLVEEDTFRGLGEFVRYALKA